MVVGVLGPVLLLIVFSLFGWTLYRNALAQSDLAVLSKAAESNRWAAQLAARSAGEQVDSYFHAVEELSADPSFVEALQTAISDESFERLRKAIVDPNQNNDPALAATRQQFLENPARLELQHLLEAKVKASAYPDAASWFVCDRWGNQIASVFNVNETSPSQTIGQNFAYRSYFNADVNDSDDGQGGRKFNVAADPDKRRHITASHLSGVFKSKATATWKIAFSTPVYIDGVFEGLAALTTEMGDFVQFENGRQQYAMLVDSRPSKFYGVVLEHPQLHQQDKEQISVGQTSVDHSDSERKATSNQNPENLSADSPLAEVRVDLDLLKRQSIFIDPLSPYRSGDTTEQRPLVAGVSPVYRTSRTRSLQAQRQQPTGLTVIAVEDYESVMQPVRRLAGQLARLGAGAMAFVVAVFSVLGFWLFRTFRRTRQRHAYLSAPSSESGPP